MTVPVFFLCGGHDKKAMFYVFAWRAVASFSDVEARMAMASACTMFRCVVWESISHEDRIDLLRRAVWSESYEVLNYPHLPWSECISHALTCLNIASVKILSLRYAGRLRQNELEDIISLSSGNRARFRRLEIVMSYAGAGGNWHHGIISRKANDKDGLKTCSLLLRSRRYHHDPSLWERFLEQKDRSLNWFRLAQKHIPPPKSITYSLFSLAVISCPEACEFFRQRLVFDSHWMDSRDIGKEAIMRDDVVVLRLILPSEIDVTISRWLRRAKRHKKKEAMRVLLEDEHARELFLDTMW